MVKEKSKVVGKDVRIDGDRALTYERYDDGVERLVGVRRLAPSLPPTARILDDIDKSLDVIEFNRRAEEAFVMLLEGMLAAADDRGSERSVSVRDVRAECAYRLGVSTETIRRYLEKYTAPSAPYRLAGGRITDRPSTMLNAPASRALTRRPE